MTEAVASPQTIAYEWLDQLYGTATDGWLTTFSVNKQTGDRRTTWHEITSADNTTEPFNLDALDFANCDIWHGVATRKQRLDAGRRGGDADCHQIPGLWLDIDIAGPNHKTTEALPPDVGAALELIDLYPIPPTAIVHSGGGLQPWWLFSEMVDCAKFGGLLKAWAATWAQHAATCGWHLDNVFDMARIMRLPGTKNLKQEEPVTVKILERWTP